jgi:hypothetical protein
MDKRGKIESGDAEIAFFAISDEAEPAEIQDHHGPGGLSFRQRLSCF